MRTLLLVTALVTVPGAAVTVQPADSAAFLRNQLGFGNADLRHLAEGKVAVRSLDSTDGREIAIAGVVRVAVTPEQYIDQLRDIVAFKRHEAVLQIGVFSELPRIDDIAGLTLDRDHVEGLRDCRLHRCDLQLSRAAIERVGAIPWQSADATDRANGVMRELLTEMAAAYRRIGDSALMTYENERTPISVTDEFRAMVAAPPALLRQFPALERHVTQFHTSGSNGVDDILYWSKEDIGPKVIISVTHMAIQRMTDGPVVYAAASKQLYGSHYFDSSLGLTLLLRDEQPSSALLVYVNRSRVDALDGFLGGLKRAIVRSRARTAMEDTLTRIRTRLSSTVE